MPSTGGLSRRRSSHHTLASRVKSTVTSPYGVVASARSSCCGGPARPVCERYWLRKPSSSAPYQQSDKKLLARRQGREKDATEKPAENRATFRAMSSHLC